MLSARAEVSRRSRTGSVSGPSALRASGGESPFPTARWAEPEGSPRERRLADAGGRGHDQPLVAPRRRGRKGANQSSPVPRNPVRRRFALPAAVDLRDPPQAQRPYCGAPRQDRRPVRERVAVQRASRDESIKGPSQTSQTVRPVMTSTLPSVFVVRSDEHEVGQGSEVCYAQMSGDLAGPSGLRRGNPIELHPRSSLRPTALPPPTRAPDGWARWARGESGSAGGPRTCRSCLHQPWRHAWSRRRST